MSAFIPGRCVVWGIPDRIHPILDQPPGRIRFRFRHDAVGACFIQHEGVTRWFELWYPEHGATKMDGPWGLLEIGANYALRRTPRPVGKRPEIFIGLKRT